jgi:serine/threonine protein kinase
MGELPELEECYRRLERERFKWPAQKFAECVKELEMKIRLAEARVNLGNDHVEFSRHDMTQRERVSMNCGDQDFYTLNSRDHWIVERSDVLVTDEFVERGGWGEVKVAEFRGTPVWVKYPHPATWLEKHCETFLEEMRLASEVHHPNLVLFMGACVEGEVMILTEILPTSLKKQLQWKGNYLTQEQRISISLDVARGLNYLHLMHPDPVIHRDINSTNIMLEPSTLMGWRAKIADYCSINFKQQYRPTNSKLCVAPEITLPHSLSPKIDIFSFGILLIELYTAKIPEVSSYERLINCIQDQNWVQLIQDCISKEKEGRPSAAELINILNHRQDLLDEVMFRFMLYTMNVPGIEVVTHIKTTMIGTLTLNIALFLSEH